MMYDSRILTAATGSDPVADELLRSVVGTARAIFGASAASIFLLDEEAAELVFQAVSGEGEEFLVGTRFPASRGIAGWVACTGQPLVVDDVSRSTSFARDLAEATAYVPNALMAAPLLHDGSVLGVLEVLDPAPQARSSIRELDLLALFARQAAVALRAVLDRQNPPHDDTSPGLPQAAHARRHFTTLDATERAAGLRILTALHEMISGPEGTR